MALETNENLGNVGVGWVFWRFAQPKRGTLVSNDFSPVFRYILHLFSLHHLLGFFCRFFLFAFLDLVGSFVLLLYFMLHLHAVLE